jgi:hypothetical protein
VSVGFRRARWPRRTSWQPDVGQSAFVLLFDLLSDAIDTTLREIKKMLSTLVGLVAVLVKGAKLSVVLLLTVAVSIELSRPVGPTNKLVVHGISA